MPKAICYRYTNKKGNEIFSTAFSATEVHLVDACHGPLVTGEVEYSYRSGDISAIFGRRPIGPRRAASKRRKL